MTRLHTYILTMLLLIPSVGGASTITFEPGASTYDWVFIGWEMPAITHSQYQAGWGNTAAFPSGETALFNAAGSNFMSMQGPSSTLQGVWISPWTASNGWYDPYSAHSLYVQAFGLNSYGQEMLVGTVTWDLQPGFHYYEFGFDAPVDEMLWRMNNAGHQWYLFDDLTLDVTPEARQQFLQRAIDAANAPNLPEPETWLLCVIGLAMVGWIHIKRRVVI